MKRIVYAVVFLSMGGISYGQGFWTPETKALTFTLAAESAFDGYTTQRWMADSTKTCIHTESDPFARTLVTRGIMGQVAASTLGVAAVLGIEYAAFHSGHRRAAKWIGRVAVMGESVNIVRQADMVLQ
jgi:hypothetical protein